MWHTTGNPLNGGNIYVTCHMWDLAAGVLTTAGEVMTSTKYEVWDYWAAVTVFAVAALKRDGSYLLWDYLLRWRGQINSKHMVPAGGGSPDIRRHQSSFTQRAAQQLTVESDFISQLKTFQCTCPAGDMTHMCWEIVNPFSCVQSSNIFYFVVWKQAEGFDLVVFKTLNLSATSMTGKHQHQSSLEFVWKYLQSQKNPNKSRC